MRNLVLMSFIGITCYSQVVPVSPSVQGTVQNVPSSLRYLGDGSDGAIDCNGNLSGVKFVTSFSITTGHTCTSNVVNSPLSIYSQGACTIVGNFNARGVDAGINGAVGGDGGGSSGGSGGGAAAGTAGLSSGVFNNGFTFNGGGTAGAITGGNGGDGTALTSNTERFSFLQARGYFIGGARGSQGGSSGGAYGAGGQAIVLVCGSVNFTGIIDVSGAPGTSSAGNSTGAGSGGGAGYVLLIGRDSVINTGSIAVQGGPGGNCFAPAIVLSTPISGLPAGVTSGTGARAHISTFVGGNPTVVTVDAAGSGYSFTPNCTVLGGAGSGATCVVTMAGVSPNQTVASIAVSGGNAGYGTGTTYTTCGFGGYGGNGWAMVKQMQ